MLRWEKNTEQNISEISHGKANLGPFPFYKKAFLGFGESFKECSCSVIENFLKIRNTISVLSKPMHEVYYLLGCDAVWPPRIKESSNQK
jgi:hypothetical protein